MDRDLSVWSVLPMFLQKDQFIPSFLGFSDNLSTGYMALDQKCIFSIFIHLEQFVFSVKILV